MSKKQLVAVIISVVIISALVSAGTLVGGVWYLNKSGQSEETKGWLEDTPLAFLTEKNEEEEEAKTSFHSLEKVVLSVKGKKQSHFVMLEVAIETRHLDRIKAIDDYMPVVRNSLLKLFSDKTYEALSEHGAVNQLQEEVKQSILLAFADTDIIHDIDDILLTKYVVQ
ncbi:flagellar basal body-associated FliL family protein [Vibrio sp. J1-1]|uniref:flagellar basal body-associated FliL family protein n=1 Tax=Vibrio sp. J1-1 TaxID=2912251 RepID=UPI001F30D2A1|nr:flagellar basal body-associated FliL family protein [Vibrio sp. J1-1]MCF7480403.1 flagellar basal body-associated FliL family protein [Vibrio sp. J1-1]